MVMMVTMPVSMATQRSPVQKVVPIAKGWRTPVRRNVFGETGTGAGPDCEAMAQVIAEGGLGGAAFPDLTDAVPRVVFT